MKKLVVAVMLSGMLASCASTRQPSITNSLVVSQINDRLQVASGRIIKSDVKSMSTGSLVNFFINGRSEFTSLAPKRIGTQFLERPDCVKYSGDPRDYDGDGIGIDYTATFDCTYESVSGNVKLNGSYRVVDQNDSDNKSGFSRNVNNMNFLILSSSKNYRINETINIIKTYDQQAYVGNIKSMEVSPDGNLSSDSNLDYYPLSLQSPFSEGQLMLDGSAFMLDKSGLSDTISYTSDNLQITNQCGDTAYVRQGTVNYSFSSTIHNNQTMVYKECAAQF